MAKGDLKVKNYTSVVAPEKSIAAIERLLLQAGTTYVGKMYANKKISGFTFRLPVGGREVLFRMPCQVEEVAKILRKDLPSYAPNLQRRRVVVEAQAERTAWRLLHDWVHLQLSMIALNQVEAMQAFLPYAYDEATDTTYFENLKRDDFRQLAPPTDGEYREA